MNDDARHLGRHPWPLGLSRSDVDQVLVVVSDIEIGAGGSVDDFLQSEHLGELLLGYCRPPFADLPLTIVFNGDTFDLLKTAHEGAFPTYVTEEVALAKLERILAAHEPLFASLRRVLDHSEAPRSLRFVVGNHDMEVLFPGVQARVRRALGDRDAIFFDGLTTSVGDVHIEHGQQHDPLFAVDEARPFLEHEGQKVLNLPWGTVALLDVVMPFLPELHQLDRLKPKSAVLDAIPEVRELLMEAFWRYWTRDYWQEYLARRDPLHRVSWTMLKEVAYRFGSGDPDVSMTDVRTFLRSRRRDARISLLGHQHEPAWWNDADRRVLRTGCFRNEFVLDIEHGPPRLLPKVYAELYLRGGRTLRSHLVEAGFPLPAIQAVPASLEEVLPAVRRLAGARHTSDAGERLAERIAQEHAEAAAPHSRQRSGFVETLWNLLER